MGHRSGDSLQKSVHRSVSKTAIAWPQDLAVLHRLNPSRYPFLLESAAGGTALGRYDLLFSCPQESLRLNPDFSLSGPGATASGQFLETFDTWWADESISTMPDKDLPFAGGWFVLLGYELARQIEPSLDLQTEPDCPVAIASRVPVAIIRDRRERRAWIVAEPGFEEQVGLIERDLEQIPAARSAADGLTDGILEGPLVQENPDQFTAAVRRAQRHIVAGDIFQANLSRRWHGRLQSGIRPVDLYERLRVTNPAPFAGLAVFDDMAVISSSPERLLQIRGNDIETRPIAGTRPRSAPDCTDAPLRASLLENPK